MNEEVSYALSAISNLRRLWNTVVYVFDFYEKKFEDRVGFANVGLPLSCEIEYLTCTRFRRTRFSLEF